MSIKETHCTCMSLYLHADEKLKLYGLAYRMNTYFVDLMLLVNLIPKEFDCVDMFKTTQRTMSIIYTQICDDENYSWDLVTLMKKLHCGLRNISMMRLRSGLKHVMTTSIRITKFGLLSMISPERILSQQQNE